MTMKNNIPSWIEPDTIYTAKSLAEVLQVSEQWIKKNLISKRAIRFKKQGVVYLILGKWVRHWIQQDHMMPDDDELTGGVVY